MWQKLSLSHTETIATLWVQSMEQQRPALNWGTPKSQCTGDHKGLGMKLRVEHLPCMCTVEIQGLVPSGLRKDDSPENSTTAGLKAVRGECSPSGLSAFTLPPGRQERGTPRDSDREFRSTCILVPAVESSEPPPCWRKTSKPYKVGALRGSTGSCSNYSQF